MFERRQTYVDQRTLLPPHSRERFSAVPDTSGEVTSIPEDAVLSSANADELQASSEAVNQEASTRTRRLPKRHRPLTTSEDDDPVEDEGLDDPVEEDIDGANGTCRETSTRSSGGAESHAKRNKGKTSTVHEHFALIQKKVNGKMLMVRKCGICGKEYARGLSTVIPDTHTDKYECHHKRNWSLFHSQQLSADSCSSSQAQHAVNKLLIMAGIPFLLAENPHPLEMLQFLNNSASL
ncbi:hypothetical protein PsorP6_011970 [Peronosclerospora sorghi]|uniref:Uncharacterized protein n=1 Tax=Peronosclerospora sorghi TaxID=230839 RepID=A0ACC0WK61_9STRA|nr:hypothetical protein PsorP6_011970 [Peronosclerospora sorghi]